MKYAWILLMLWAMPAQAKEPWPMFQHNPAHDAGVQDRPIIKQPQILLRTWVGLLGAQNNPIIADGQVFIASASRVWNRQDDHYDPQQSTELFGNPDEGRSETLYAIDLKSGRINWLLPMSAEPQGLAWADGYLAFTVKTAERDTYQPSDSIGVIDTRTHKILWEFTHPEYDHGFYQPLILGNKLIGGNAAGEIMAFDLQTGHQLWKRQFEGVFRAAPASDGQNLYLASTYGQVICLRPDGTLLWQAKPEHPYPADSARTDAFPVAFYAAPTLTKDMVILSFARNALYPEPAVLALDKATGQLRWWARDSHHLAPAHANIRSSPALWQSKVIVAESFSQQVLQLNAGTGVLEKCMAIGQPTIPHWPSPAINGEQLILPRHDGYLYAWNLTKNKLDWKLYLGQQDLAGKFQGATVKDPLHPAWMPDVGDAIYVSPAIASDGSIVVGADNYLYRVGESSLADPHYQSLAPGIWLSQHLRTAEHAPIYLLKVDPRLAELVPIFDEQAHDLGLKDFQKEPGLVAAINSSFFNPTAIQGDLKYHQRIWRDDALPELDSRSDRWSYLAVTTKGLVETGRGGLSETGHENQFESFTGGFPQLFSRTQAATLEADVRSGAWIQRMPFHGANLTGSISRSFLGVTAEGEVLLVVMGTGNHRSKGATLAEGALLLHSLGAVEAYILDGGGSSCVYLKGHFIGRVRNRQMKSFLGVRTR